MSNKRNQFFLWILILFIIPDVALGLSSCGEKIPALGIFDQISQYALWVALAFMISIKITFTVKLTNKNIVVF